MLAYFEMSNRIADGFLRLFGEKLGISSSFSYKTIERRYDPERSKKLLDQVLFIMNEFDIASENIFSTDGTGDPATMKINYESKRSQQRLERSKNHDKRKKESDTFPHSWKNMTSSIQCSPQVCTQRSSQDSNHPMNIPWVNFHTFLI